MAPVFHGYSRSIADILRANGHDVRLWHYDDHGTFAGRATYKIRYELPSKLVGQRRMLGHQVKVTKAAVNTLKQFRPEIVLTIKGDILGEDFWLAAEELGCQRQLWLYDELRRMNHDPAVLARVEHLVTYSATDAKTLKAAGLEPLHVPNGFDSSLLPVRTIPNQRMLFVGARYPNREDILTFLSESGLPTLAVGRDWSHHPVDRIRTWSWRRPPVSSMRDVPRRKAYGLMAGALGNINVHNNQDGFTMRTFEIPGVGGVQFVDRPDVADYYEPEREVLVYESLDELLQLGRRVLGDPGWSRKLAENARIRTLAHHTLTHRVALVESQWA